MCLDRNMKIRFLSLVTCLICFSLDIQAETIKNNGLTFITGADTAVVKGYSEIPEDGKLTIPSEIVSGSNSYKVTAVKNSAFMACPELRELTISPSVKYIENYAFSNCVNLKKVTFEQGDDVLNIYEESFQKCPIEEINMGRYLSNEYLTKNLATLRKVVLEVNIDKIQDGLFQGSSLEDINLSHVQAIGADAFRNCENLQSVDISNAGNIGEYAFYNSGLQSLIIPSCVNTIQVCSFMNCKDLSVLEICGNPHIDWNAFSFCEKLEDIVLSETITSIPHMFEGCKSLKNINLNNITTIATGAFRNCISLEDINLTSVQVIGDNAFKNTNLNTVTFGKDLLDLGKGAFEDCNNLSSVNFSTTKINTLRDYTFSNCVNLKDVQFSSCLTTIGNSCFSGCQSMEKIDLSTIEVESLGSLCFNGCKSLKYTDLSTTKVTTIPNYCFKGCVELSDVILNVATDTIGECAFVECSKITNIQNTGNIAYVGKRAFEGTNLFSSISRGDIIVGKTLYKHVGTFIGDHYEIPDGITSVSPEALMGQDFQTISIGKDVVTIGDDALSQCKSLISLTIPETVLDFGNMSGCDNLSKMTIKSGSEMLNSGTIDCPSVTKMYLGRELPKHIRYNMPALSNLTVGKYVTQLNACSSCANINTLDLEDSDLDIELYAIDRSHVTDLYMGRNIISHMDSEVRHTFIKLAFLTIGNKVTYIPDYFMQGGNSETHTITEIIIPSNVKQIGKNAFGGLRSNTIDKITLNEGLEDIGDYAFGYCSINNVGYFKIPTTVKNIGMGAFSGLKCDKIEIPEGIGLVGVESFSNMETDSIVLPSTFEFNYETFAFSKLKYVDASRVTCENNMKASFEYNSDLEKIILPQNIKEIGQNEFWYCKKLDGLEIPSTVSRIGQNALVGIKQRNFIIPSNVVELESQYFEDSKDKTILYIQGSEAQEALSLDGEFTNVRSIKNRQVYHLQTE